MVRTGGGHDQADWQMTPEVRKHGPVLDDRACGEGPPVCAGGLSTLPVSVRKCRIGEPKRVHVDTRDVWHYPIAIVATREPKS